MPLIVREREELVSKIRFKPHRLIGVHGAIHSGKTDLSKYLAKKLNGKMLDMDEFFLKPIPVENDKYPNFIDYPKFLESYNMFLETGRNIIINRICLLEILQREEISPDLWIYCRNQNYTEYINEDIKEERLAQALAEIDSLLEGIDESNCMEKDNAIYHFKYKPVTNSDFIYIWENKVVPPIQNNNF